MVNKTGRTIGDVIAENIKVVIAFMVAIIIGIAYLILNDVYFKVGNVEIGNKTNIIHDTIIKTKVDTHFVEPKIIKQQKTNQFKTQPIVIIKHDTILLTDKTPSNINTGTNNGIIGNNNDVKVNVNEIQRKLSVQSQQQLINLIRQEFEKKKKSTKSCIRVTSLSGNSEAFNFATEIAQFLKQQDFNVDDLIGQFQCSPPIKGVSIGEAHYHNEGRENCLEIKVGYR